MTKLTITTSIELTDAKKTQIQKALAAKYGRAKTYFRVDDALIGGIIIFDGEKVYDGSLRNQLDKIKERLSH